MEKDLLHLFDIYDDFTIKLKVIFADGRQAPFKDGSFIVEPHEKFFIRVDNQSNKTFFMLTDTKNSLVLYKYADDGSKPSTVNTIVIGPMDRVNIVDHIDNNGDIVYISLPFVGDGGETYSSIDYPLIFIDKDDVDDTQYYHEQDTYEDEHSNKDEFMNYVDRTFIDNDSIDYEEIKGYGNIEHHVFLSIRLSTYE